MLKLMKNGKLAMVINENGDMEILDEELKESFKKTKKKKSDNDSNE